VAMAMRSSSDDPPLADTITIRHRSERGAKTGDEKRVSLISQRRFHSGRRKTIPIFTYRFYFLALLGPTLYDTLAQDKNREKSEHYQRETWRRSFSFFWGLLVWFGRQRQMTGQMALDYGYTHVTNFLLYAFLVFSFLRLSFLLFLFNIHVYDDDTQNVEMCLLGLLYPLLFFPSSSRREGGTNIQYIRV
jgi:hypothetical protein